MLEPVEEMRIWFRMEDKGSIHATDLTWAPTALRFLASTEQGELPILLPRVAHPTQRVRVSVHICSLLCSE